MPAPQYTRNQILNQNTNDFPNNNAGLITPAILRDYNANVANSVLFLNESVSSSISASYADFALTASHALNTPATSSYALQALSSSYAATASFLLGTISSASYAATADNAQMLDGLDSTSFVGTGSYNIDSASFNNKINSLTSATSSYITAAQTASMSVLSSSYALTASFAANVPATASYALQALSSSFALTASYAANVSATASYALQALSASHAVQANSATSASAAINALTASVIELFTDNGNTSHKVLFTNGTTDSTGQQILIDPSNTFNYNPNQNLLSVENITVSGTASFANVQAVTGSAVIIGQEFIILNTQTPAARYAGLVIYDSGSSNTTASVVWDSETNHFVYQSVSGSTYSGGGFMAGPRNTGSLADITYPTLNRILRGQGDDHLYDSNIVDDGTVKILVNTQVTGTLDVSANITGNLVGTASYSTFAVNATSASVATSASHALSSNNSISSSYALTASFAANVPATASYALQALSSSFANNASTASYVSNAISSSYSTFALTSTSASHALNANNSISSSYALTASFAANVPATASYALQALSSSFANNASTASFVLNAISSSYSVSSSFSSTSISSSFALNANSANTASYVLNAVSASFVTSASFATNALTASFLTGTVTSASYALSSSFALSASWAPTSQPVALAVTGSGTTLYSTVGAATTNFSTVGGVFLGVQAGNNAPAAQNSVFIGPGAGAGSTYNSVHIGQNAGGSATNAFYSILIGQEAGNSATDASEAVFIGNQAGYSAASAEKSVFIGDAAGFDADSASYSVLLGPLVGRKVSGNVIGTNNIIIGNNITLPANTVGSLNIGGILFGTGSHGVGSGDPFSGSMSNGRIGINKVVPEYSLDVSGSGNFSNALIITGSVQGNVTSASISSATASLDFSQGSFFTSLVSGSTFFNITNPRRGQTVNLLLTTSGIATASFSSNVKQVSGSRYTPTSGSNLNDIITFISWDGTTVYLSNVKNLI